MDMQQMPPEGLPTQAMGPEQGMMPPPMEQPPIGPDAPEPEDMMDRIVDFALSEINIAKHLKDKKGKDGGLLLDEIGNKVVDGYTIDEDSRLGWMERNAEWLKLAMLVRESKSYPWPRASNVKYPLLATAAMQFSARAYPALVPSDGKVVKARVLPYDPQGMFAMKAEFIAKHMSYQVMENIPNWEEDMDKLLMSIAISGICFKKTYHNSVLGVHHSHLVYPENFCVNYWAKNLEKAYRKTEILKYTQNEYLEKVNNDEEYLEHEFPEPVLESKDAEKVATGVVAPPVDESTPLVFLAQHTFYDLDGDGYEEPYIITVHKDTKKVVRIIARWDSDGVKKSADGKKIVRIVPVEYFTAFPFIPNPDGSIYALGFGLLLGPMNESVNSIINQLIDSGTLNNLQSGFIGKGLRLRMGVTTLQPGEWKVVNASSEDLARGIFPLPTKEPSGVLFNLLNMLITSGNQLASIAEIFVGKMPGQNTPATTTQETVKQGMAVFTAIYKRVYRSLMSEFKKIHRLNRIVPGIVEEDAKNLKMDLIADDYDDDNLIIPGGDPTGDSETTKMTKVQQVGGLLQLGTIDPMAYTKWSLKAMEIPDYESLLPPPPQGPPPPSPEEQAMQAELQMKQKESDVKIREKEADIAHKERLAEIKANELNSKTEASRTSQAMDLQGQRAKISQDMVSKTMEQRHKERMALSESAKAQADAEQTLRHKEQMHQQKMRQDRSKPKNGTKQK
jgi:chaperonin GroES